MWSALTSLFGSAGQALGSAGNAIGKGFGKLGTAAGDWASGGFGMIPGSGTGNNPSPRAGMGARVGEGGGLGSEGLLFKLGSALFGGQNKALENTAMAYRRAYEGSEPLFNQARGRFTPYSVAGGQATGLISSLLGMGGSPGLAGTPDYEAYLAQNPDVAEYFKNNPKALKGRQFDGNLTKAAEHHYNTYGKAEGRELPMTGAVAPTSSTAGGEGLARFRESLGYQDTLNQALGGVATNAAARGLLGSSGSGRAFQETAANLAQGTFSNYLDRLLGQQSMGMEAAGALGNIDLSQGSAKSSALFGEHSTRGQKKSSFLSKLFG